MKDRPLTPKQAAFVRQYLVDLNSKQAAIRAGYSAKTAEQAGSRAFRSVQVRAAIEAALAKRIERVEVNQDYVLSTIHETVQRCRQAEPVRDRRGVIVPGVFVFNAKAVLQGCEMLGKHLGMFRERISLENPDGSALVEGTALGAMAALVAAGVGTVTTREARA